MLPNPPALVFGIPIVDLTIDQTMVLLLGLVERGRRLGLGHQVATVNMDFVARAERDRQIRAILQRADLCVADGAPVVWGAKLSGSRVAERVAGADLMLRLVQCSHATGLRIYVLGSTRSVALSALDVIAEQYPNASVTIHPCGEIRDPTAVDRSVLDHITACDPDVLCVALGHPKQERFIAAYGDQLRVPVMMGVGGSLDFFSRERRRAPRWLQDHGLEWTYRMLQEPRRLGPRYARDAHVLLTNLLRDGARVVRHRRAEGLAIKSGRTSVEASISDGRGVSSEDWAEASDQLVQGVPLTIHHACGSLPSRSALSAIVGLVKMARWSGADVEWDSRSGPDPHPWCEVPLIEHLKRMSIRPEIVGLGAQRALLGSWWTRDPERVVREENLPLRSRGDGRPAAIGRLLGPTVFSQ